MCNAQNGTIPSRILINLVQLPTVWPGLLSLLNCRQAHYTHASPAIFLNHPLFILRSALPEETEKIEGKTWKGNTIQCIPNLLESIYQGFSFVHNMSMPVIALWKSLNGTCHYFATTSCGSGRHFIKGFCKIIASCFSAFGLWDVSLLCKFSDVKLWCAKKNKDVLAKWRRQRKKNYAP